MSAALGPVVFDYPTWGLRYPDLAPWVGPDLAQLYFNEATLYLSNTACSPVRDMPTRATLLNMLTAHIAALNAAINGQIPTQTVGRISNASQGSVSVTLDYGAQPNTAAWYSQTKYGAAYYTATAGYRAGGRYRPGPQPYLGVTPWGFAGGRY